MKRIKFVLYIIVFLFILLIQLPTTNSTGSFVAVIPSRISLDNAVRGEVYPGKIILDNGEDYAQTAVIDVKGDIADWEIIFYHSDAPSIPITSCEIMADSSVEIFYLVNIPDDITLGTHYGNISIISQEDLLYEEPGAQVILESQVLLEITVILIADFFYYPTNVTTEDTVQFVDNTTHINEMITSWFWYFGDGNNSSLKNPLYKYNSSGEYTVTLNVTLSNGKKDMFSRPIVVQTLPIIEPTEKPNETNGNETSNKDEENNNKTPGFELIIIICVIALFIFWKRKK